jgi:hypothetical protein
MLELTGTETGLFLADLIHSLYHDRLLPRDSTQPDSSLIERVSSSAKDLADRPNFISVATSAEPFSDGIPMLFFKSVLYRLRDQLIVHTDSKIGLRQRLFKLRYLFWRIRVSGG